MEPYTPSPNTSSCNKQGTRPNNMLRLQHATSIDAANSRALCFLPGTDFKFTTSHDRHAVSSIHNTDRHCQFHGAGHPLPAVDFEPKSSHDRHAVSSTHNTDLRCQFQGTRRLFPAFDFKPVLYHDRHPASLTRNTDPPRQSLATSHTLRLSTSSPYSLEIHTLCLLLTTHPIEGLCL